MGHGRPDELPVRGVVVIGEGEKDQAPMLHNGEEVGNQQGPACDVAVHPIDGTTLTAKGMGNAISVLAVSPRGSMFDSSAVFYMDKLVTGPGAAGAVDIEAPVARNVRAVAKAKGIHAEDVTVCLLDRRRYADSPERCARPARIRLVADSERARALAAGHDLSRVLTAEDLVADDEAYFVATGVTGGQLLRGVRYGLVDYRQLAGGSDAGARPERDHVA